MKVRNLIKRYILKAILISYVIISFCYLVLLLERNYRMSLINYGQDIGENNLISQIIKTKPCDIIELEKNEKVIKLISLDCQIQGIKDN